MVDDNADNTEELQEGDINSNLTLSMVPSQNSIATGASANGPLAPIVQTVPDLNQAAGLELPNDGAPLLGPDLPLNGPPNQAHLTVQHAHIMEDWNLVAILQHQQHPSEEVYQDPMQFETSQYNLPVSVCKLIEPVSKIAAKEHDITLMPPAPDGPTHDKLMTHPAVDKMGNETSAVIDKALTSQTGENSQSDYIAPPGFPGPIYAKYDQVYDNATLVKHGHVVTDPNIDENIEQLGAEGAQIWETRCAPKQENLEVIQVPIDWVNFYLLLSCPLISFPGPRNFLNLKCGMSLFKDLLLVSSLLLSLSYVPLIMLLVL